MSTSTKTSSSTLEEQLHTTLQQSAAALPEDVVAAIDARRMRVLQPARRATRSPWLTTAAIVTLAISTWLTLPLLQAPATSPTVVLTSVDPEMLAALDMLASMEMLEVMADI